MMLPPDVQFHEDVHLFVWRPRGVLDEAAINKVLGSLVFRLLTQASLRQTSPDIPRSARLDIRVWPITWLLIRIACLLIVIHMFEIAVWALFFWWQKCLPDAESSFYFSGVTYATIGYGDLVLPKEWRLFGPLEALTGTLMCGLSTAFLFVIVSKRILQRVGGKEPSQPV